MSGTDEGPALAFETISTWDSRVAATLGGRGCGRIVCTHQGPASGRRLLRCWCPLMTGGVSSRCLRRRRSPVACRWSSRATQRLQRSQQTEQTDLDHLGEAAAALAGRLHQPRPSQLLLPILGMPGEQASGLDPVDAGVGAEGQSQQPQCLVGGDADLGRSGPRRCICGHRPASCCRCRSRPPTPRPDLRTD
jgi:hypothetical protein